MDPDRKTKEIHLIVISNAREKEKQRWQQCTLLTLVMVALVGDHYDDIVRETRDTGAAVVINETRNLFGWLG